MPAIKSINCENGVTIVNEDGIHTFGSSDVPQSLQIAQDLENSLNNVWLPLLLADYQMQAHVFTLSPLSLTICTANNDVQIQPNWWQPVNEVDVKIQTLL